MGRECCSGAGALAAHLSLLTAEHWLNPPPLRPDDLRGKVVLVNFWTYSCINSLRALPYVRAWADKYRDRGLVTVGVHTPEFAFEQDIANVQQAVQWYDVRYPVPTDNRHAIWRAFRNDGWPAFYLIGADGRLRYRIFGEGDYDRSERAIQRLLSAAFGSPVATRSPTSRVRALRQRQPGMTCIRPRPTSATRKRATLPRRAE